MKKILTTAATLGVTLVASGGLLVGLAGSASAATPPWETAGDANSVGSLSFYDASGNIIYGGNLTDSPIAAYVKGSAQIRSGDTKGTLFAYTPLNGQVPGQWSGEALGASTIYPNAAAPAPLNTATLPVETGAAGDEALADDGFPNTDTSTTDGYSGIYQLRLRTSGGPLPGVSTQYDSADIQVTGSTWQVIYPAPPPPPAATPTTTTLTAAPATPQPAGTAVTLTATESPATPGTIQFEDGTTALGTPVTVSAAGSASISWSTQAVATHSLHAVFTPTSSAFSGSTGDASFVVTAAPPPVGAPTTTGLGVSPATAPAFTAVGLTATVTKTSDSSAVPAGAGSVKFYDNAALLSSAPVTAGGVATLSYNAFATGTHNITATFVPADTTVWGTSSSLAPVAFTATAPTTAPASQTIDTVIPGGGLTITTPYSPTNPFHLGTAVLQPANNRFEASAPFGSTTATDPTLNGGVTITDTRAGNQPWTASATVTDFTDSAADVINGSNLSFTGVSAVQVPGNGLLATTVVPTNIASAALTGTPFSATDTTVSGLKGSPHTFATVPHGLGEVDVDGQLTLDAPTSTPAGTYTATLTFTVA